MMAMHTISIPTHLIPPQGPSGGRAKHKYALGQAPLACKKITQRIWLDSVEIAKWTELITSSQTPFEKCVVNEALILPGSALSVTHNFT